MAALVRQKEALARAQALGFQLERSELKREAVEARLALLQAQVTPHFLFNTLAKHPGARRYSLASCVRLAFTLKIDPAAEPVRCRR